MRGTISLLAQRALFRSAGTSLFKSPSSRHYKNLTFKPLRTANQLMPSSKGRISSAIKATVVQTHNIQADHFSEKTLAKKIAPITTFFTNPNSLSSSQISSFKNHTRSITTGNASKQESKKTPDSSPSQTNLAKDVSEKTKENHAIIQNKKEYKILSIDGGGIRGIIPAMVLCEIEKRTGKPISTLFDYIAGTSTGGILALGLNVPNDDQRKPRYSASDLLEIYEKHGYEIFERSILKDIRDGTKLSLIVFGSICFMFFVFLVLSGIYERKNYLTYFNDLKNYFSDPSMRRSAKEMFVEYKQPYFTYNFFNLVIGLTLAMYMQFARSHDRHMFTYTIVICSFVACLIILDDLLAAHKIYKDKNLNTVTIKVKTEEEFMGTYIYDYPPITRPIYKDRLVTRKEAIEYYLNKFKVYRDIPLIGLATVGFSLLLATSKNLIIRKHSSKSIEKLLKRYFLDIPIRHSLKEILVTSYCIKNRNPTLFTKTVNAMASKNEVLMREAANATLAAPTYFNPFKRQENLYIDGGVVANNPSMCAYAHALKYSGKKSMFVVSLGTGVYKPKERSWFQNYGLWHWGFKIIKVMMEGTSEVVDWQMNELLGNDRYKRIQLNLEKNINLDSIDDIEELIKLGKNCVQQNNELIDQICQRLLNDLEGEISTTSKEKRPTMSLRETIMAATSSSPIHSGVSKEQNNLKTASTSSPEQPTSARPSLPS